MFQPWLKKSPFMSLWLSTANRVAGSARGQATAQAQRPLHAATADERWPHPPLANLR